MATNHAPLGARTPLAVPSLQTRQTGVDCATVMVEDPAC